MTPPLETLPNKTPRTKTIPTATFLTKAPLGFVPDNVWTHIELFVEIPDFARKAINIPKTNMRQHVRNIINE